MTLATAATKEGIEKLINRYYYSTSCYVQDGRVFNGRGQIADVEVKEKKGRFIFKTIK